MLFIAIIFIILFVAVMSAALFILDDLETTLFPALIASALGAGSITVSLSEYDRTLLVGCVLVLALAIIVAAFLLSRSRKRPRHGDDHTRRK